MTSVTRSTPLREVATIWPDDANTLSDRNVATVSDLLERIEQHGYSSLSDASIPREHLQDYYHAARIELSHWRSRRNARIGISALLAILVIVCFLWVPELGEKVDPEYTKALKTFGTSGTLDEEQVAKLEDILVLYESLINSAGSDAGADELRQLSELVGKGESDEETMLRARNALQLLGVYRYTQALGAVAAKEVNKKEVQDHWEGSRRVDEALGLVTSASNRNLDTFKKASSLVLSNKENEISSLETKDDALLASIQGLELEMMEYPDVRLRQQRELEWKERKQEIDKLLEAEVDPLVKTLGTVETTVARMGETVGTMDTAVATMGATVGGMETTVGTLDAAVESLKTTMAAHHSGARSKECGFQSRSRAEDKLGDLCDGACPAVEFVIQIERPEGSNPTVEIIGDPPAIESIKVRRLRDAVVKMISSGGVEIETGPQHRCRLIFH